MSRVIHVTRFGSRGRRVITLIAIDALQIVSLCTNAWCFRLMGAAQGQTLLRI